MKPPEQYPDTFLDLLEAVDVSRVHLAPKHPASLAGTIAADTVEVANGLALVYKVKICYILRAALVIGIEEMLSKAEELGHYGAKKAAD